MDTKAFENVKNQIGYCAIWCGSCIVGNGTLKELTRRYGHLIGGYGVDQWGAQEQGFNGQELMRALQGVQRIPICRGCLKGGGATNCRIRACASRRKLADCTLCGQFMTCDNREPLEKVRTGALAVGMLVKTDKDRLDSQRLVKKWSGQKRNRFPDCVVLSQHGSE